MARHRLSVAPALGAIRTLLAAATSLVLLVAAVDATGQPGVGGTGESPPADGTSARPYLDLEEGKAAARSEGKPLVVLFRTEDCSFTRLFFEQTVPDPSVQLALSEIVLTTIDVSRGKGKFVGKMHEVKATPTFVLYDPDRGPLHQWKGWGQVAFLQNLGGGIRSDTPVVDRLKRQEAAPTAEDAALLGFFHASVANFEASLREFGRAEELNPEYDFRAERFDAAASGYAGGQVSWTDLASTADRVIEGTESPEEVVNVAAVMVNVTDRAGGSEKVAPYLRAAFTKAAGSDRADIRAAIVRLEPYRLLYLESDPAGALEAYQRTFPGWPNDPDALNNVAWWCLIHDVALEEAEGWAREAVTRSANAKDRANARDTLADILVRRGNRDEAIQQLFKAFEEAPEVMSYGLKLRELGAEVEIPVSEPRVTIGEGETQP